LSCRFCVARRSAEPNSSAFRALEDDRLGVEV
jgi:hypothetical protein